MILLMVTLSLEPLSCTNFTAILPQFRLEDCKEFVTTLLRQWARPKLAHPVIAALPPLTGFPTAEYTFY
jgi:hypothetical protein